MSYYEFPHTRTYDSDLGWLIKRVSSYDEVIKALNEWIENYTPKIDDLTTFMNALNNGKIPEGVKRGIYEWCNEFMPDLVARAIVAVTFELTQDGYFVAEYADSWESVQFNTTEYDIAIAEETEFGHLVLTF